MFNLGFSEILVIGVLALLLIGPKQLPEVARALGRLVNEFKRATQDLSGGLLDIKKDLKRPMQEAMNQVKDAMKEPMDSVKEAIHDPLEDLKKSARQHMKKINISDEVVRIKEDLATQVQDTPEASVKVVKTDENQH